LTRLVAKALYAMGELTEASTGQHLKLPYSIVKDILTSLCREKYCEIKGPGDGTGILFRYALTDLGLARAQEYMDTSQYVGPAPVTLAQFQDMVQSQSTLKLSFKRPMLEMALRQLVLTSQVCDQLGGAVNSGTPVFLYGESGNGKTSIRGNYRLAYDRINTFVFSSAIFQSIPGITAQVTSTAYGQAGGRLPNLPTLQPTGKPEDFLQPPSVSANSMRVVDPSFQSPRTHGWVLSVQREILKGTIVEATYVGRKADHLFGAYNINQAEYRNNGFLEAFNVVKAGGQSPLMNQLLLADTRRQAGETGSDMVRRLYASTLTLNSVAGLASSLGTRIQSGRTLPELAGFGPYFFFPYPQYLGGLNVIDSGDWSRYDGLELKLERSFRNGFGYLVGYTLSRSKDTRSFDPAFTVVGTANAQSASSTPFDIYNRSLNYAYSDFDRRHAVQAFLVAELPFGSGKRFGGGADGLVNGLVGGWQLSALVRWFSGRPMTVYSGSNTFSSVVQTPANCSGCTGSAVAEVGVR